MNNSRPYESDQHRALQILNELSGNNSVTQRDISSKLGIALGLVNSYLKNLVAKGYVTVKSIPPRRYAYFLTPKGFSEKTRLTYDLLHDYTRIYREARKNLKILFGRMSDEGVRRIVFAGADEVAEIAYLTLQETGIELAGVVDGEHAGKTFFGRKIGKMEDLGATQWDRIVIVSYLKRKQIYESLRASGADIDKIIIIFPI